MPNPFKSAVQIRHKDAAHHFLPIGVDQNPGVLPFLLEELAGGSLRNKKVRSATTAPPLLDDDCPPALHVAQFTMLGAIRCEPESASSDASGGGSCCDGSGGRRRAQSRSSDRLQCRDEAPGRHTPSRSGRLSGHHAGRRRASYDATGLETQGTDHTHDGKRCCNSKGDSTNSSCDITAPLAHRLALDIEWNRSQRPGDDGVHAKPWATTSAESTDQGAGPSANSMLRYLFARSCAISRC
mmetsp:Transcript_150040/g.482242  ORF Transcript_150040/g.482242 Transcript_150040/m.482242 type:complete len:240 (-) Transcript_150040:535-1254(-)